MKALQGTVRILAEKAFVKMTEILDRLLRNLISYLLCPKNFD